MRSTTTHGRFSVREIEVTQHGFTYSTWELSGWEEKKRVRMRFKSRADALGEKNRREVAAANRGELAILPTRLTVAQLADAEAATARLGGRPLSLAVEWFLNTYRPPVVEMELAKAETAFLADRALHVRPMTLRDYKLTLRDFREAMGAKHVHEVKSSDVLEFLTARNVGKKRWNNLRGDLNGFFEFAKAAPRQWTQENPVANVTKFKLTRGVPEILT